MCEIQPLGCKSYFISSSRFGSSSNRWRGLGALMANVGGTGADAGTGGGGLGADAGVDAGTDSRSRSRSRSGARTWVRFVSVGARSRGSQ